jgi:hypothetical protein
MFIKLEAQNFFVVKSLFYCLIFSIIQNASASQVDVKMRIDAIQGFDENSAITQNQKKFKLVLPNSDSLEFSQNLLEQADFFKPMLREGEQEIPISLYITKMMSDDSSDVSLFDLRSILSVLAESSQNTEKALAKIFVLPLNIHREVALLQIANYYGIALLEEYLIELLSNCWDNALFQEIFDKLPSDIQPVIISRVLEKIPRQYRHSNQPQIRTC